MTFDKRKSRDKIMHYLLQFCLGTTYSDGTTHCHKGFSSDFARADKPRVGDLVRLTSIRAQNWSICWLLDTRHDGREYLCESVETGEQCWWSNVGIGYFDRETVENSPEWRWTDRQHKFDKRWERVCYKDNDAYSVLPLRAQFGDGYEVTLQVMTRHGLDEYRLSETFCDWRKVTKAMMSEFYSECVKSRAHNKEPKI